MKLDARPQITLTLTVAITEQEARALDALAGYGVDAFLKHFYEHLGRCYMEPHAAGLRTFLEGCKGIATYIGRTNAAREVFEGLKVAVKRAPTERPDDGPLQTESGVAKAAGSEGEQ